MICCDLLITGGLIYCYLLCNNVFTAAKTQILSSSEYCQWKKTKLKCIVSHMIKLECPNYFIHDILKKITALVTSSGHSVMRHEVSRMFTIILILSLYVELAAVMTTLTLTLTFFKRNYEVCYASWLHIIFIYCKNLKI